LASIGVCAEHENTVSGCRVPGQQLGEILHIHRKDCVGALDHLIGQQLRAMFLKRQPKGPRHLQCPGMSLASGGRMQTGRTNLEITQTTRTDSPFHHEFYHGAAHDVAETNRDK